MNIDESLSIDELVKMIDFKAKENISASLANRLIELIVNKQIPPNYVFPGETILCEKLGVGRGSLREAYKILESSGYISRSRRGTVVNSNNNVAQAIPFHTVLALSDYNDLMEFRYVFEIEIARLAALRADSKNIATLEYNLAMMKASKDNIEELSYYDMLFHVELAKSTKNKLLITTMEMASPKFLDAIMYSFQLDTPNNIQRAIKSHEDLLSAVRNRDTDNVITTMRTHMDNIWHLTNAG